MKDAWEAENLQKEGMSEKRKKSNGKEEMHERDRT